ncbi:MAG: hypothetical protein ACE15D_02315 [Candidatus Eisenbacteria bacterium]
MRVVLVLLAVLLIAGTAVARDVAKNDQVIEGVYTPHSNQIDSENPGSALVVSIIAGTFTDLGPAYVSALTAAGEAPVDLIYDPMGNWPSTAGYTSLTVDCSDLWWSGYFLTGDENQIAAFLDAGKCAWVIGQDYLYQRGSYTGFPQTYLGVAGAYEDANYNDASSMTYDGTAGGPLEGVSGSMFPCMASNPWFTDEIYPLSQGLVTWSSDLYGPAEGGSVLNAAAFSTVEYGCDDAAALTGVMQHLLALCGPVATQEKSWGSLKGLYR